MLKRLCLSAAAVCCVAFAPAAASAGVFGTNLIVNGDAEAGPSNSTGGPVASIPGFTPGAGGATVIPYGAVGGYPQPADPGPSARGAQLFAGGNDFGFSSLTQTIDLSSGASIIDLGGSMFDFSAYLGGFSGQNDIAVLKLDLLDGAANVVGSETLTGPNAVGRGDQTGLFARFASGIVPIGTRSAFIELDLTRTDGTYNDGYADNLSLVLTPGERGGLPGGDGAVPEPGAWALMLTGFGALGATLRSRRGLRLAA